MTDRELTTDLVVVLPGITGSTLEIDAEPVWGLSGRAIMRGVVSLGRSVDRLKLPEGFGDALPDAPGEGEPQDGVRARALMPDLHVIPGLWSPIKGYSALTQTLRKHFAVATRAAENIDPIIEFPYDWRLSNVVSGRRLEAAVVPALEQWQEQTGNPDARLVLVCHSMGGLVARWFLEVLGGWELTRWLVTIGTPYQGSVNALDGLVNGLSKGLGPFRKDLTELARSFPSMYELLPTYPCFDTGPEKMQSLGEIDVPHLRPGMLRAAAEFHDRIADAVQKRTERGYRTAAIKGITQPTSQSARLTTDSRKPLETLQAFAGEDKMGDGTVARPSSHPPEWPEESDGQIVFAAQRHATLQETEGVFTQLFGLLTTGRLGRFMGGAQIGMEVPDLLQAGEALSVEVTAEDDTLALSATVTPHDREEPVVEPKLLTNLGQGRYRASFPSLPEGTYQVTVDSAAAARQVESVADVVIVWESERD